MDKIQDIKATLKMYNQEHVINLLEKLNGEQKRNLIIAICAIVMVLAILIFSTIFSIININMSFISSLTP